MDYLMTDIYIKDNSYIAYSIEPKKEVNYKWKIDFILYITTIIRSCLICYAIQ
jgi:hypothetical protein